MAEPEIKFFRLRLPEPLHTAIAKRADKNKRSINAEVTVMLEEVLKRK